jgi:Spy/CpxP family protein refolding chaperone
MDIFTKNRFTFWTIVILVILNISTISMLWFNQNRRIGASPQIREPRQDQRTLQFLQKELNLTDEQIQQYDQLRQTHAEQTRLLVNDVRDSKREMMNEIFNDEPDIARAMQIADLIGKKQTELERITFKHFSDLKELCGKEQLDKLHELMDEFFRRNPPEGHQEPPPHQQDRTMNPPPRENKNRE